MGNNKSKEIEGIRFRQKKNSNLVAINFRDNFVYPKKPKDEEINKQLQVMFLELDITEGQRIEIENLPFSIKWKLICRHNDYIM